MPVGSKRKPKDDEQSVASEIKAPVKNYQALMGEGEKFYRDQLFTKAIQCYTEALELNPDSRNALVERATCYLKLGKNELALQDAEESLKQDKEFTKVGILKGLYQKAEALYAMGEFELALVFFHRGKKVRPDVREFQLGINKAQEAIDNCVGDPESVKLEVKGDLSYFDKPDEKTKKSNKQGGGYSKPSLQKQHTQHKREKRAQNPSSQKTIKQLLGELYADRVYLEQLLDDNVTTKPNTKSGDAIYNLANSGLNFLDSRTEFWRQQKPIYARKAKPLSRPMDINKDPTAYIFQQLDLIDNLQNNGKYSESLHKCESLIVFVNKQSNKSSQEKSRIISNIYSNMGNAYLELGKYDQALQMHNKDFDLSRNNKNEEDESRALENLGRVFARSGKFKEAIDVWEKKLPLVATEMEKAWLYHEVGRCYLELSNCEKAEEYGMVSAEAAASINDEVWQLNATVLIAQSQAKFGDIGSLIDAVENFEKALNMTSNQKDEAAEKAIVKAYNYCKERLKKLEANENLIDYKVEIKSSMDGGILATDDNAVLILSISGNHDTLADLKLEKLANDADEKNVELFVGSQNKDIGRIKKIKLVRRVDSTRTWHCETVSITKEEKIKYVFNVNKSLDPTANEDELELIPSKKIYLANQKGTANNTKKGKKVGPKEANDNQVARNEEVKSPIKSIIRESTKASIKSLPKESSADEKEPEKPQNDDEYIDEFATEEESIASPAKTPYKTPVPEERTPTPESTHHRQEPSPQQQPEKAPEKQFHEESQVVSKSSLSASPKATGEIVYTITVHTGNVLGGGTDSDVFIVIYGDGETAKLQLKKPNEDAFEQGDKDKFEIQAFDVGDITKINMSHNGEGFGAGWYLKKVTISKPGDKYYEFQCDRWLDRNEGDGKTEIDLFPI